MRLRSLIPPFAALTNRKGCQLSSRKGWGTRAMYPAAKAGGFISFTAGLKTCSTLLRDTVKRVYWCRGFFSITTDPSPRPRTPPPQQAKIGLTAIPDCAKAAQSGRPGAGDPGLRSTILVVWLSDAKIKLGKNVPEGLKLHTSK